MPDLSNLLNYLIQPPWVYFWGAALALLVFIWITHGYRVRHRPIIPFKTSGGRVEIAPQTLKNILQFASTRGSGVDKASCYYRSRGRSLEVKVAIHLRANTPLKTVETEIKRRIRQTLKEQFGMESIEPIHIKVAKLVGEPEQLALEAEEQEQTYALTDSEETDRPRSESDDDRPHENKA